MEEWLIDDCLAAAKTNASNTGRTDVFGKSDYFVNKCSGIFYWSNGYIYIFGWNDWISTSRQSLVIVKIC
jgi:hypothetical protein